MFTASGLGHLAIAELLLSKGAYINQATAEGRTPLYFVAQNGHLKIVELVLFKGANSSICYKGYTHARIAALEGHHYIVELLSKAASSPGSADGSIGPRTYDDSAPAGGQSNNTAAKECEPVGGTEELRRVDELSCQVQGLRAEAPGRMCDVCKVVVEKLKSCPCRAAFYCSAECQKQAWPNHQKMCSFKKTLGSRHIVWSVAWS